MGVPRRSEAMEAAAIFSGIGELHLVVEGEVTARTHSLVVDMHDSLRALKLLIQDLRGMASEQQRLTVSSGQRLSGSARTLLELGLKDGDQLNLNNELGVAERCQH